MKAKSIFLLTAFLFTLSFTARGQEEAIDTAYAKKLMRISQTDCMHKDLFVYKNRYSAFCQVWLSGHYDEKCENFEKFDLIAAVYYNPEPGANQWFVWKPINFDKKIPLHGKATFTALVVDKYKHETLEDKKGRERTQDGMYLLEKEGKCMAVEFKLNFNGKKWKYGDNKNAMKVKAKIKLIDKDKIVDYSK